MKDLTLLALGAGALALVAAKKARAVPTVGSDATRAELEGLARDIAAGAGVDPALVLATVDTENYDWDVNAVNMGPGDSGRGGAWGLGQMTYTTGRNVDDKIHTDWGKYDELRAPTALLEPVLNLTLVTALIAENAERAARRAPVGSDPYHHDIASLYNSGNYFENARNDVQTIYVPRFMRNLAKRKASSNGYNS